MMMSYSILLQKKYSRLVAKLQEILPRYGTAQKLNSPRGSGGRPSRQVIAKSGTKQ
jgi:hypothetical protein